MKYRKVFSLILSVILLYTMIISAYSIDLPENSTNYAKQNYSRWSQPVTSYLCVTKNNELMRVEYLDDKVVIETYDAHFIFWPGDRWSRNYQYGAGSSPGKITIFWYSDRTTRLRVMTVRSFES